MARLLGERFFDAGAYNMPPWHSLLWGVVVGYTIDLEKSARTLGSLESIEPLRRYEEVVGR
eukprot:97804-Hanusia_phi.AAC.1